MAIPDYQTVMLPLLRFLKDGREHNIGEVVDSLAEEFNLSAEEREQLLGSGQQTVIRNRAGWARTYLKKAGLISSTRRGYFRITERGQSVLSSGPDRIDVKYLEQFPEFLAFRELRHEKPDEAPMQVPTSADATPEEALDAAYGRLRLDLEAELLDQVKSASPSFFERLVVALLHGSKIRPGPRSPERGSCHSVAIWHSKTGHRIDVPVSLLQRGRRSWSRLGISSRWEKHPHGLSVTL